MVTQVSGYVPLLPALEPASPAPLGLVGSGSTGPLAEEPVASGADDPANLYLLAKAHYGGAPETSGLTLASVMNELGHGGV